jgi:glycerol-3-phosphate dehydrogenase
LGKFIIQQTAITRTSALSQLSQEVFDVLVIGGGIAGACAAWDASLRGLRTGLVERSDFGSGTSAHSLKVLHGGIRYLQHLDIARLRESCRERAAFLRIAPHLTRPIPFALPTYGMGLRGKLPLRAAFGLLDLLTAGRNRGIPSRSQHIPSPYIMSRREFIEKFPAFEHPELTGAGIFYDGQICNPARVVYSIIRAAQEIGAAAVNYCAAERLLVRDGRVEGVVARDQASGATFDIRARVVANLTGPFAPTIHERYKGGEALDVPLSRDMAFVVNRQLLPDMALGIQTRYRDPDAWLSRGNRHIFIVPWRSFTLIGVHSRVYQGDPFKLTVTPEEIQGFVEEIREACPAWNITRDDVAVVNAGLLPIGENQRGQKGLSLGKRSLLIDHAARGGLEGLVTGMSVRWTTGRQLAEQAITLVSQKLSAKTGPSRTATTPVYGGDMPDRDKLVAAVREEAGHGVPEEAIGHLVDTFGTASSEVLRQPDRAMLPDGRTLAAEVRQAAQNEMTLTLADIVLRRLDLGTGCEPTEPMLCACAGIAGQELGWDTQKQLAEISRVRASYPFASPASQECSGIR